MSFFPFIIAICGIAMPVAILAIIFGYENRSEQRFHETVQKMVDSGQEINEDVIAGIPGYKKVLPRDDMRNGINTIGTGIGLSLLGLVGVGDVVFGVGLLVACIGAALIANARLNQKPSE